MKQLRMTVVMGLAAAWLIACGEQRVTGPEIESVVAAEPAASTVAAPQPIAQPGSDSFFEARFLPGGDYSIRNVGSRTETWVVYRTTFDDQSTPTWWTLVAYVAPGGYLTGTVPGAACSQVDVTQGRAGDRPFAHAFYDREGRTFHPGSNPEKLDACRPKPTPIPTPYCPPKKPGQNH